MIFYAAQRKGLFVLVLLIAALLVLPRQFLRRENNFFLLTDTVELPLDTVIPHKPSITVELNTADSTTLVKIKGIGPYYSSRILKYRERLGGYYSVDQLKELKMKYLDVDSIKQYFTVDPSLIIKKDLNQINFKEVLRHPYLDYEEVKQIFNAKDKNKAISFILLKEQQVLPADKLKKIKPYFK